MIRGIGLTVALLAAFLCSICSGRQAIFARGQSSKERLVGVTVVGETVLNIISVGLPDFDVNVLVPNATEVNIRGNTPSFSTAVCKSKMTFLVAVNDVNNPRVVVVDLANRKVLGTIAVNGILIDNIECDEEGNGFAYVFQLGYKHTVIKMDFNTMSYSKLMHSSYKSYGGSSIDSKNKRFFTVADTPYYDSFNYSISVMEYGDSKEYLTLPFKHYSIGSLVYDPVFDKLFGFVQTPPGVQEGVKYATFLAELDLNKGSLTYLVGPWERVALIEESGLTLDVDNHMIYLMTDDKIRKIDVQKKQVLFERPASGIPWPTKCYEFANGF